MKRILFLSLTIFYVSFARADLNLKIALMGKDGTNSLSGALDRIKENKIREDQFFEGINIGNKILNFDTGEEFKLSPDRKSAVKIPFDQSALTNVIPIDAIRDTGKTEIVDGYDTKIYILTNSDGSTSAMWIAKDFPHFEIIKKDLAKRDRLSHSERIHFSTLPGMLLKCSIDSRTNAPLLQFFVNEEPIDASIFELPKDYHFNNPPSVANTNAPIANTNEVISATNEPPVK